MGRKPNTERSDITPKSQPSKASQRNEEYRKYQSYIRSKAFKEVKKIVWERDSGTCQFCGRKQSDGVTLSVHHRCYKHLYEGGEKEADDCILICSREHKALHSMKCNYQWFSRKHSRNNVEKEKNEDDENTEIF